SSLAVTGTVMPGKTTTSSGRTGRTSRPRPSFVLSTISPIPPRYQGDAQEPGAPYTVPFTLPSALRGVRRSASASEGLPAAGPRDLAPSEPQDGAEQHQRAEHEVDVEGVERAGVAVAAQRPDLLQEEAHDDGPGDEEGDPEGLVRPGRAQPRGQPYAQQRERRDGVEDGDDDHGPALPQVGRDAVHPVRAVEGHVEEGVD